MKKIFSIIMAVCMMVGVISATAITTSAYDPNKVVMSVSGMTENGSKILTEHYENFESAWNDAVRYATDHAWMKENGVVCVVVDLKADWIAENGKFGEDNIGFKDNTILVPKNSKIMINMLGHTIDRGLTESEDDGEVIYMAEHSTLIINGGYMGDEIVEVGQAEANKGKMGTITGGFNDSGAGGILVESNCNLTLNNVHIDGNTVDGECGAAIALFDNSTLKMNGGSISNNYLIYDYFFFVFGTIDYDPYGSLYLKNSDASLNNVEFIGNHSDLYCARGTAIYAIDNSNVTMRDCLVKDNSSKDNESTEIIYAENSTLDITDTDFIDNGLAPSNSNMFEAESFLFYLKNSEAYITGGKVTGNSPDLLFRIDNSHVEMRIVTITDNTSWVMHVHNEDGQKVKMINCTLNNNQYIGEIAADAKIDIEVTNKNTLEFEYGDLGDTVFHNKSLVVFKDAKFAGSIFSEGSLSMILSLLAIVVSIASIFICVALNKKKAVGAKAPIESKTSDEE